MGERALAAVRRGDQYSLYRSQSGGSDEMVARLFDARTDPLAVVLAPDWRPRGSCPAATLPDALDYHALEAVYCISPQGLTVWHPVWLGLWWPGTPATAGTLVRVGSLSDHRRLRALVTFLRAVCRVAVQRDLLVTPQARAVLALAVWVFRPSSLRSCTWGV